MPNSTPVFVSRAFICRKANRAESTVDAFFKRTGEEPDAIFSGGTGFNMELYSMPRVENLIKIMNGREVMSPAPEAVV